MISWTEAGVDQEAEKDPRPGGRPGAGQWASCPAVPALAPGEPGGPLASSSLGFVLGKTALAVPSFQAASFLEFSLTRTLLDPFTSSVLPAFAGWWLHQEPLPLLWPGCPAHPPDAAETPLPREARPLHAGLSAPLHIQPVPLPGCGPSCSVLHPSAQDRAWHTVGA